MPEVKSGGIPPGFGVRQCSGALTARVEWLSVKRFLDLPEFEAKAVQHHRNPRRWRVFHPPL